MSAVDCIDYEGVVLPGWCIKYQTHGFLPRITGPRLVKVSMQSGLLLHAMIKALIFEPHESRDAYMYPPSLTEGSRFMCRRSGASLETGVRSYVQMGEPCTKHKHGKQYLALTVSFGGHTQPHAPNFQW